MVRTVNAAELRESLRPLLEQQPGGAVLFDADGTLWAHDVGQVVFEHACKAELLRDDVTEALIQEARGLALEPNPQATPGEIGLLLVEAYEAGAYDERAAAEMMVWAYAGFTTAELRELAQAALHDASHRDGLHREVVALAAWARELGAATFIVSASPRLIVEEAARELGFLAPHIAGGVARERAGRFEVGMLEPLPYGPSKVTAGRALTGARPWLAAFGDSGFDLELLGGALFAVGIGEKSALLAGLPRHPAPLRLHSP